MKKGEKKTGPWILGDGHVHFHEQYQDSVFFRLSLHNFQVQQDNMPFREKAQRFLFLTESFRADWFGRWKAAAGDEQDAIKGFSVALTGDSNCLQLKKNDEDSLFVVAGRQIVTAESLEVLALGLEETYPDGRPITTVLAELGEFACLRILPWGAGKWLGKRGKIIRDIIANWEGGPLFVGDNGNRPGFWPLPSIFSKARKKSIYNIPGSDPLPFAGQEQRAGSYGFSLPGKIDTRQPFSTLHKLIMEDMTAVTPYGETEHFVPFFRHQVAMQLCKKK